MEGTLYISITGPRPVQSRKFHVLSVIAMVPFGNYDMFTTLPPLNIARLLSHYKTPLGRTGPSPRPSRPRFLPANHLIGGPSEFYQVPVSNPNIACRHRLKGLCWLSCYWHLCFLKRIRHHSPEQLCQYSLDRGPRGARDGRNRPAPAKDLEALLVHSERPVQFKH